jgi:hypothetical protein
MLAAAINNSEFIGTDPITKDKSGKTAKNYARQNDTETKE